MHLHSRFWLRQRGTTAEHRLRSTAALSPSPHGLGPLGAAGAREDKEQQDGQEGAGPPRGRCGSAPSPGAAPPLLPGEEPAAAGTDTELTPPAINSA